VEVIKWTIYRTSKTGRFNVPYASYGTGEVPDWARFSTSARALRCADVRCADFEELIDTSGEGDLLYLDPPYAVGGRRVFGEYYGERCFGIPDLPRLAAAIARAARRGADFLLSYADCPEALGVVSQWNVQRIPTPRQIAAEVRYRCLDSELMVSNMMPIPPCGAKASAPARGV
jgi:DNA adenine methylase